MSRRPQTRPATSGAAGPARRTATRRRRATAGGGASPGAGAAPVVVLAGPSRLREPVFLCLSRLPLVIEQVDSVAPDGCTAADRTPAAVIVALADLTAAHQRELARTAARLAARRIPLVVTTRRISDRALVGDLYRAGVTVLFRWPAESAILADALRNGGHSGVPTPVVQAASRLLRTYYPGARFRVAEFGGAVVLEGTVDSPEKRRAIAVLVARVPGVRRVVNKLDVLDSPGDT